MGRRSAIFVGAFCTTTRQSAHNPLPVETVTVALPTRTPVIAPLRASTRTQRALELLQRSSPARLAGAS